MRIDSFVTLNGLSGEQVKGLVDLGLRLKKERREGTPHPVLAGKTLAMIFAKASTRTRVSFEAGMFQLGGHALCLNASELQLGRGESIADTAMTLSRYVDAIMIRTFSHADVEELARCASVPVINGLTDAMHPTQAIADVMALADEFGADSLKGLKLAYVGDGNNVAHSLMHACGKLGIDIAVATPKGFECDARYSAEARHAARISGSKVEELHDPAEAVAGADAVYTDTWASMGQEAEKADRAKRFSGFQVDGAMMALAKPTAIFLHCLPAYRGMEVAASVIDGPQSRVFDEAENRLHAHKAILASLLAR